MTYEQISAKLSNLGVKPHGLPNAIGLWPNELECIVWCAGQADPKGSWVEIGCFCGATSVALALAKDNEGLVCVDLDFNPMFDVNVANARVGQRIQKIEDDSSCLHHHKIDAPVSFAFIDGYHSFKQVVRDFDGLAKYFEVGSVVAFHDVSPKMDDPSYRDKLMRQLDADDDRVDELLADKSENFLLDEAVCYLLQRNPEFEYLTIPVKKEIKHFAETGRRTWQRGKTSPFNAVCAIRKATP